MKKHEQLVVDNGLQSVIDHARQHAADGHPDRQKAILRPSPLSLWRHENPRA